MTDYEMVLICALRYALGRRSYMVGIVTNYIDAVIRLGGLSDICKAAMITEIEQTPDYGDECDKADWLRLLEKLKGEIE